jgi:hypothetical protein
MPASAARAGRRTAPVRARCRHARRRTAPAVQRPPHKTSDLPTRDVGFSRQTHPRKPAINQSRWRGAPSSAEEIPPQGRLMKISSVALLTSASRARAGSRGSGPDRRVAGPALARRARSRDAGRRAAHLLHAHRRAALPGAAATAARRHPGVTLDPVRGRCGRHAPAISRPLVTPFL